MKSTRSTDRRGLAGRTLRRITTTGRIPALLALLLATAAPGAAPAQEAANSWPTRCTAVDRAAPMVCTVTQRLTVSETGAVILALTLRTEPGAPDRIIARTPNGIHIPSGVTLVAGEEALLKLDVQQCNERECVALAEMPADLITRLDAAAQIRANYQLSGQAIGVPVQTGGLADAYARIRIDG